MTNPLRIKALVARSVLTIVTAALMSIGMAVHPQSRAEDAIAPAGRLNLSLEQKHVIKELIKDLTVDPAATPAQTAVGDTVPQDAKLRPMPNEIGLKVPQIKAHRFMYTADRILIVDPKDNKVAEVIELKDTKNN
jgi:Protein of unknown function (DUF1236)